MSAFKFSVGPWNVHAGADSWRVSTRAYRLPKRAKKGDAGTFYGRTRPIYSLFANGVILATEAPADDSGNEGEGN